MVCACPEGDTTCGGRKRHGRAKIPALTPQNHPPCPESPSLCKITLLSQTPPMPVAAATADRRDKLDGSAYYRRSDLRIVPPPSTTARQACELLASPESVSAGNCHFEQSEHTPQIIWLQSKPHKGRHPGHPTEDTAPRPLVFLPVSDNPEQDALFFSALETRLQAGTPLAPTTPANRETSQDSKHKDLVSALQFLENYHPIFFPVRAERLTPTWAHQQALRLKRLPKEVVFLLSTSGSTKPGGRLVGLSLPALKASHQETRARLGTDGIWISALPRDHIAGFQVIARAFAGGTKAVTIDMTGGFKVSHLTKALLRAREIASSQSPSPALPLYLSLVPTQLRRALANKEAVSALRLCTAILVGGARISPVLLAAGRGQGLNLVTTYGMTETCGGCVYDGVPLPGVKVAVNAGRVWLCTPGLMSGYLEEECDCEIQVFNGERWLRTNDWGRIVFEDEHGGGITENGVGSSAGRDEDTSLSFPLPSSDRAPIGQEIRGEGSDGEQNQEIVSTDYAERTTPLVIEDSCSGHLEVLGRMDDTIICGGVNVSLPLVKEVSEKLGFSGIEFCGLPDEEWGEVLCAVFSSQRLRGYETSTPVLNPKSPDLAKQNFVGVNPGELNPNELNLGDLSSVELNPGGLCSGDLNSGEINPGGLSSRDLNPAYLGQKLRAALRGSLPASHLPRAAAILPDFPLLPSGKIDRRTLKNAVYYLNQQNLIWRR